MKTRIREGGRLVIPSAFRKALGLKPGDEVLLSLEDGEIRVLSTTVNLSEVVAKLCEAGMPEKAIYQALQPLGIKIVPFDENQAYQAGLLRASTQNFGISLGDRACLSLAKKLGVDALTADKAWAELSLGTTIKVIR